MMSLPVPQSACPECQGTGVFPETVYYPFCDLYGVRYCSCPAGEAAFGTWCQSPEVQAALKQKRAREVEAALAFSRLPRKWHDKTLASLEGQEEIKLCVNRYLDRFPQERKEGRGMYLWSPGSGRGKTHILSAVCREIMDRYAVPCIFLTEEQIFRKIREAFDDPQVQEYERMRRFRTVPCLFVDDFGATKPTAWKQEVMTGLLDERLNNALPTFFTSNYSLSDYQTILAHSLSFARPERVPSRIFEMCRGFIVEVKGEDWRKK